MHSRGKMVIKFKCCKIPQISEDRIICIELRQNLQKIAIDFEEIPVSYNGCEKGVNN